MPAKPTYWNRLPLAIEALEQRPDPWVGRRTLEELLGVSKTVAWRILRRCGPREAPGGALVCDRLQLLARLRTLTQEPPIEQELTRRARLASHLAQMRSFLRAREIQVVPDSLAAALISTRFGNLPPSVTLTPQSLHIEFFGTEDFLQAIGAVVYALQNDYEAISDFIEEAG